MPRSPSKILKGLLCRSGEPRPMIAPPVASPAWKSSLKDASSPSPYQELAAIKRDREDRRALSAMNQSINLSQVHILGDKIEKLEISISLPPGPPWPVDSEQVLLQANGKILKLKTALEDYHELALFIERHCWNVTSMAIRFQFLALFSHTFLIKSIRTCLRMLASVDHDMSFTFTVTLASPDTRMFDRDQDKILEDGLAKWIDEIYREIKETRQASIEVEGLYSSRQKGDDVPKEKRVPVPAMNFGL